MIQNFKPYPTYKDSGVPWLGKVPEHWEVRRGKGLFNCIDIRSNTGGEELMTVSSNGGVIPRRTTTVTMFKAESYLGYKLCWPGDLVINSLWAWAGGLGVSRHHGIVSSAYGVYRLRPEHKYFPGFFHELARSTPFQWELQVRSKGIWTSRLQLTDESFLEAPLPVPPPQEQSAIIRYLNYMDRRIRRYILAKQKLIKLLNEQKQAIIHKAVTRGLDPNVRLKPSGVEWLGDVPEHWSTISLGAASELIQTGPFGSQLHAHEYIKNGTPVINPSHLHNGRIVPDMAISVSEGKLHELQRHKLRTSDIVVARRGEMGRCGLVGKSEEGWLCGTGSMLIRPKINSFNSAYLQLVFSSQGVADTLRLSSIGATMDNLNTGMVARLRLPLPGLQEQVNIVRKVENERHTQNSILTSIDHQISLLREYRARLIADVVTGKLDVRDAAARLPDEVEEPELTDKIETLIDDNETSEDTDEDEPIEEAEA